MTVIPRSDFLSGTNGFNDSPARNITAEKLRTFVDNVIMPEDLSGSGAITVAKTGTAATIKGQRDIIFGLVGALSTGTNVTNYVTVSHAATCVKAYAVAKTGPSGGSAVFTIKNGGTTVATLTMTTGTTTATATTTTTLAENALLSIDIGTTNGVADVTVTLTIQYN